MEQIGNWLISFGDSLTVFGDQITNLGLIITPFSFIFYIILSFIQYKWRMIHYTKAAKGIWYLAVGLGEITGDERIYLLVVLMIFMDCIDSLFDFLEEKRELKNLK